MNIVTRLGNWIEKHFPEKMTAEEARLYFLDRLKPYDEALALLVQRLEKLEKEVFMIRGELETVKTQLTMKTKVTTPIIAPMSPFASRRVNGGNESPR